jgi:hypothetical protein
VYQRLVVAGQRFGVEAQHPIRVPAAVADEAATQERRGME